MKRMTSCAAALILILALTLGACAVNKEGIIARGQSAGDGVFRELNNGGMPPAGYADLTIRASLKAYPKDHFLIDPERPAEVVSAYPFVLNIGGQGAVWKAAGTVETAAVYDEKGKRAPEGGEGIRYSIEKKVRVPAGTHTVFFGVPEEGYAAEEVVSLPGGTQNVIEFKPVYRRTHRGPSGRVSDFAHGLAKYEVYLNGAAVR